MRIIFKTFAYLFVTLGISLANAGSYEDFFTAVIRDDGATITRLVARGFDPNSLDPTGQTALHLALRADSASVVEALLAAPGIDVNVENSSGETPLMMAALKGQLERCQQLLARGAEVNKSGWTPLHYAATGPAPTIVQLLIDKGARVDAPSPNRSTPLMMAAGYGAEANVDLLLGRGADPRARNELQLSAADFARRAQRESLAERLDKQAR